MKHKMCICLVLSMALALIGCACESAASSDNRMLTSGEKTEFTVGVVDYSTNLFQQVTMQESKDANVVLSPISAAIALSMVENGASGETLSEIEHVLCNDLKAEKYRAGLADLLQLCSGAREAKYSSAQSIWVNKSFGADLQSDFVHENSDQFKADVRVLPFDNSVADAINQWASDATEGEIQHLVEQIPDDAAMYLINATLFEGLWQKPYEPGQSLEGCTFHTESGIEREVTMLSGVQPYYIELNEAKGFVKPYEGGEFDFVAILPPDGVSAHDFILSVTGQELIGAYKTRKDDKLVYSRMPVFDLEFNISLNESLQQLGLKKAFTSEAEFNKIVPKSNSIFISQVSHNICFAVDQDGTRASAASTVEMTETAANDRKEMIEIILDRPFFFEVVEVSTGVPVFMGLINDVGI